MKTNDDGSVSFSMKSRFNAIRVTASLVVMTSTGYLAIQCLTRGQRTSGLVYGAIAVFFAYSSQKDLNARIRCHHRLTSTMLEFRTAVTTRDVPLASIAGVGMGMAEASAAIPVFSYRYWFPFVWLADGTTLVLRGITVFEGDKGADDIMKSHVGATARAIHDQIRKSCGPQGMLDAQQLQPRPTGLLAFIELLPTDRTGAPAFSVWDESAGWLPSDQPGA